MTLVRGDLGTPHLVVCPRCKSEHAERRPILIIKDTGVTQSPWSLDTCRDCGLITKTDNNTTKEQ